MGNTLWAPNWQHDLVVETHGRGNTKEGREMSLQAVGYFYMGDWHVFNAAFPVSYGVKAKEVDLYRKAAGTLGYTKLPQGQLLHFSIVEVGDPQSLIGEANQVFLRLKNQYFPIHVMFNFDDYKQELEQLDSRYPNTMDDVESKRYIDEQIEIIAKLFVEVLPPVMPMACVQIDGPAGNE